MAARIDVPIPEAFAFLFDPPLGSVRYRVAYGGRGSAKSWQFARALLVHGLQRPLRILCAREFQTSIRDSVHRLLADQIERLGLGWHYEVQQSTIRGRNGTEFIFKGIRHNVQEIKSTEGIDICWVEEAEAVSDESWRVLTPTIRKEGSEIWVSFNPALESDPTYQRFVVRPPERAIVRRVTYRDNPWLPQVLRDEAEELFRRDPEAYAHVWGGEPWRRSDAEVLAGRWIVEDFEPQEHWQGPYYGADWGFARDPTVLVRVWIADNRLYVEYDERGIGWGMDEIARRFDRVPGAREHVIRADSARPETINAIWRRGFRIEPAPKWPGSVEDGVEHLRSYERIVIHPRCRGLIEEARLWRYKVDPRTDDVLPKLAPGYDHGWDAVRYALAPLIRRNQKRVGVYFPGMEASKEAP
ncbi:MAG: PBSX family phage terminase large subunit [Actinobacteria bacterium]|nr:MAG: PBSX family phage terminase large subunit [Actinomycetota bacterium]